MPTRAPILALGALLSLSRVDRRPDFNEEQDRHGDPKISLMRYATWSEFGAG